MRETPLAAATSEALDTGDFDDLITMQPSGRRDLATSLNLLHGLWIGSIHANERSRWQNHPAIAGLKWRLEATFLKWLDSVTGDQFGPADPVAAIRRLARRDDLAVYDWLANSADLHQVILFLAVEGGPDAGFDDLVALAQVGVTGPPKVVLGENYWDEMGRGDRAAVHTVLHDRLVAALDLPRLASDELPVSALERTALLGVLATNRWLQPELLGALGLVELQAGPRCRRVVHALKRVGAPADALPFYEEHAQTDPRHGKLWLEEVIAPLIATRPDWSSRLVRGATWRAALNEALFTDLLHQLAEPASQPA